ncbi:hypothetical protein FB45DRAFT_892698 [Roridomyces roridus]|uniref:Uncharacterized protein n=1 Tax=Roridomyces roridus TaxID=1738132 RepID=A0AAD7FZ46_9AGAR|nr:hypothetical protein FB45DRAFT_892698 [Roridomyces roridus]
MKFQYPAAHEPDALNDQLLALKIARHHACLVCDTCTGLHPAASWDIVLDDVSAEPSLVELDQYGSDDDEGQTPYLKQCACGHDLYDHGANQPQLGRDEFLRRGRVAIRLDELLQDVNRLLDFSYVDQDIVSLRNQMIIPHSLMGLANIHSSPALPRPRPRL